MSGSRQPAQALTDGSIAGVSGGTGLRAVFLGMTGAHVIDLDADEPAGHIVRLLGDSLVEQGRVLDTVTLWVASTSADTATFNPVATWHLHRLLRAVAENTCPASRVQRAYARRALRRESTPIVFGDCVITGRSADGDLTSLDDIFHPWLTGQPASSAR